MFYYMSHELYFSPFISSVPIIKRRRKVPPHARQCSKLSTDQVNVVTFDWKYKLDEYTLKLPLLFEKTNQ